MLKSKLNIPATRFNPLAVRLIRREGFPGLTVTLTMTFGIWLVGLAFYVTYYANSYASLVQVCNFIGALLFVSPLVITPITALLTAQDSSAEPFELICLTTVSDAKLVRGYLYAALYRLRLLLIVMVGVLPLLLLSRLDVNRITITSLRGCFGICDGRGVTLFREYVERLSQLPEWKVLFAAIIIGQLGMSVLGAAVGVGIALKGRTLLSPIGSTLVAWLLMLFLEILMWGALWSIWQTDGPVRWRDLYLRNGAHEISLGALVGAMIPYLLTLGLMKLAERWIRQQQYYRFAK